MTEREWLLASPPLMMHHINQVSQASPRRLRLLAVAYARFLETQPDYARSKHVSHLGEEVVEGRQTVDFLWSGPERGWGYDGDWSIANLVLAGDDGLDMAIRTAMHFSEDRGRHANLDVTERPVIARTLIRCVLGNPFCSTMLEPSWRTSDVLSLAEGIYQEKAFDRMPILADALQDAGCNNEAMLNHCRSIGPHVRGCFVVDLILGKS